MQNTEKRRRENWYQNKVVLTTRSSWGNIIMVNYIPTQNQSNSSKQEHIDHTIYSSKWNHAEKWELRLLWCKIQGEKQKGCQRKQKKKSVYFRENEEFGEEEVAVGRKKREREEKGSRFYLLLLLVYYYIVFLIFVLSFVGLRKKILVLRKCVC